jgi:hypothetical protein
MNDVDEPKELFADTLEETMQNPDAELKRLMIRWIFDGGYDDGEDTVNQRDQARRIQDVPF